MKRKHHELVAWQVAVALVKDIYRLTETFPSHDLRGYGLGHALYSARRTISQRLKVKRIIACGRLRGYHKFADERNTRSAFRASSRLPFARDGIAAEGTPNMEQIVIADLDLDTLTENWINGTTIPLYDKRTEVYDNPIEVVSVK